MKKSVHKCFKKVRIRKNGQKKCSIFKKRKIAIIEKNENDEAKCNDQLAAEQAKLNYEKVRSNIYQLKSSKNGHQNI